MRIIRDFRGVQGRGTRRTVMAGLWALGAALLTGCGHQSANGGWPASAPTSQQATPQAPPSQQAAAQQAAARQAAAEQAMGQAAAAQRAAQAQQSGRK